MYRERLGREVWLDLHSLVHFGEPLGPLVEALSTAYPCLECRRHLLAHLAHDIRPLDQDEERWLVDLHNVVNRELGKPERAYPYCALYDRYYERVRRLRREHSTYHSRLQELHRRCSKLTLASVHRKKVERLKR